MIDRIQYIAREGRAEYAVVPIEEWNRVVALAEDTEDTHTAYEAMQQLRDANDETVPVEVVEQLLEGGNPIAVWRKFRGLSQQQLADAAGVTKSHISQIENGTKSGSLECMRRIADRLAVDLDDVVVAPDDSRR